MGKHEKHPLQVPGLEWLLWSSLGTSSVTATPALPLDIQVIISKEVARGRKFPSSGPPPQATTLRNPHHGPGCSLECYGLEQLGRGPGWSELFVAMETMGVSKSPDLGPVPGPPWLDSSSEPAVLSWAAWNPFILILTAFNHPILRAGASSNHTLLETLPKFLIGINSFLWAVSITIYLHFPWDT